MHRRVPVCYAAAVLLAVVCARRTEAQQQPMGTVPTADARVTGQMEVRGSQAALLSNVSVTAFDHTAPVTLRRGGALLVCSTSEFHLLHSSPGGALVFGLDRGALELRSQIQPGDLLLTPDLKFTPVTKGAYDLRLRVTREGDTCVENAGADAPVLNATDAFSSASYRILPGQHLLFVKGDLHRVVDHERSSCGCPAAAQEMAGGTPAAQAHPFPQAQSEGLAPTSTPGNEASVGTASSQVTTTLSYGDGATAPPIPSQASQSVATGAESPAQAPRHGLGAALRRFFHRLFHPGS